eukprot:3371072-Prymnesium_polylepis.1
MTLNNCTRPDPAPSYHVVVKHRQRSSHTTAVRLPLRAKLIRAWTLLQAYCPGKCTAILPAGRRPATLLSPPAGSVWPFSRIRAITPSTLPSIVTAARGD